MGSFSIPPSKVIGFVDLEAGVNLWLVTITYRLNIAILLANATSNKSKANV